MNILAIGAHPDDLDISILGSLRRGRRSERKFSEHDIHIFPRLHSSVLRHSFHLRVEAFICGANIQPDHFGFACLVTKREKDTSLCLCHHALSPASDSET